MDLGLKDKVVLCMASAAGLGKGIATEMAREGAKVMICTAEPFKDQLLEAQAGRYLRTRKYVSGSEAGTVRKL